MDRLKSLTSFGNLGLAFAPNMKSRDQAGGAGSAEGRNQQSKRFVFKMMDFVFKTMDFVL